MRCLRTAEKAAASAAKNDKVQRSIQRKRRGATAAVLTRDSSTHHQAVSKAPPSYQQSFAKCSGHRQQRRTNKQSVALASLSSPSTEAPAAFNGCTDTEKISIKMSQHRILRTIAEVTCVPSSPSAFGLRRARRLGAATPARPQDQICSILDCPSERLRLLIHFEPQGKAYFVPKYRLHCNPH